MNPETNARGQFTTADITKDLLDGGEDQDILELQEKIKEALGLLEEKIRAARIRAQSNAARPQLNE